MTCAGTWPVVSCACPAEAAVVGEVVTGVACAPLCVPSLFEASAVGVGAADGITGVGAWLGASTGVAAVEIGASFWTGAGGCADARATVACP